MVRSLENGILLPPFLVKCYDMVNDESTNELISWTESNDSFVIWDESRFSSELLPKYFKHGNFSSFVRQLNIYGFKKIDTDRWQFGNDSFIKGEKHLLKNISRRKQIQSSTPRKLAKEEEEEEVDRSQPSGEEDMRVALRKEVENLKTDKSALMQEFKKLRQHQEISQNKLLLLRERLNGMEKNQQQMLSFIVMVMQSPEFMVQFFQTMENNWRLAENGSSKLSEVTEDYESPPPSDGTIVAYQPPKDETLLTQKDPEAASYADDLMDFDFSSEELRDLLLDMDVFMSPKDDRLLPLDNLDFSFENPERFLLPDAPVSDIMLDQLLSSGLSRDDEQVAGYDDAEPEYMKDRIDTFEKLAKQLEHL